MAYLICKALVPYVGPGVSLAFGATQDTRPNPSFQHLTDSFVYGVRFGREDFLDGKKMSHNPFMRGSNQWLGYDSGWADESMTARDAVTALLNKGRHYG